MEWAERIRRQVDGDFDRVAAAFRLVADRQSGRKRADTEAILIILEDKRTEVMARGEAGISSRNGKRPVAGYGS